MILKLNAPAELVCEFFYYALTAVLFLRGVYPHHEFRRVRRWGIPLFESVNPDVVLYLRKAMFELKIWIARRSLHQLALVIVDYSDQPAERWHFNVSTSTISQQDIKSLQATMRQIGASVSYLPILTGPHSFHIVIEDDHAVNDPGELWSEVQFHRDLPSEGQQKIQFTKVDAGAVEVSPEVLYCVDPRRV